MCFIPSYIWELGLDPSKAHRHLPQPLLQRVQASSARLGVRKKGRKENIKTFNFIHKSHLGISIENGRQLAL